MKKRNSGRDWVIVDGVKYMRREDVIEECARVAESYDAWLDPEAKTMTPIHHSVASAIRALKDKS